MNSLLRADLLNRCHAGRSYLGQIKADLDAARQLKLAVEVAQAMNGLTECIAEINRQEEAAMDALQGI